MRNIFALVVIAFASMAGFSAIAFGQDSAGFAVSGPAWGSVEVHLSYRLTVDDAFVSASKSDPQQTPAKVIWYFGDDKPGQKQRNYAEQAWTPVQSIVHSYPAGKYGIMIVIVDRKGRLVKQDGMQIEVGVPVKRVTP